MKKKTAKPATLLLRLPAELKDKIAAEAKASRRSTNSYILTILESRASHAS